MEQQKKWIAVLKFLPLIVFASLVIVYKLDLLIAAPFATGAAVLVYIIIYRTNFDTAFQHGVDAARRIMLIFFILMFAYGVAECFMATGVGASLILLALARGVTKISKNVHQLMGWCGVICLLGNIALADEAAQVATMSPIVRKIVEKNVATDSEDDAYRLRLRLATFTSSMGIYGSQMIPWHCFPVFFASIANAVYPIYPGGFTPMDIISRNYLSFLIVGSILILTFTGWDRFVPRFGLPKTARIVHEDAVERSQSV